MEGTGFAGEVRVVVWKSRENGRKEGNLVSRRLEKMLGLRNCFDLGKESGGFVGGGVR